ncbi:hypothetical protein [uncultured Bacteroides sp.]|uniref:hypothetical protein n=1 Tax=uncultured Bacteroides sp. TaxID=162156 RepID=UPI002596093E|nr:hypothetical protein [uncultured Bacteroides sp.]
MKKYFDDNRHLFQNGHNENRTLDGISMRKDDFKMPKEKGQGKRASCYYFALILDIKF